MAENVINGWVCDFLDYDHPADLTMTALGLIERLHYHGWDLVRVRAEESA